MIGTMIFAVAILLMLVNVLVAVPPHPERSCMSFPATTLSADELQQAARDHLWLHFTRMSGYADGEVPIIVRGDGCYLEDINGKRYLDALAGLFAVNIGYGFGEEIGEAAAAQLRELPFYTNWSYAHPRAIELAAEVASVAPGDLNRVFFVSGGSEAVESAWKLARQYHAARGERRWKAIARRIAYHGTTMGALSINGIAALKTPFEPLVPDTVHVRNTNRYHRPPEETEARVHGVPPRRPRGDDRAGRARDGRDGDHGAGAERRRGVHAAGGLLGGRARDLRPLRDPPLRRRGDHRLRPGRRLVRLRALRHPPGLITSAKGLSSAHASIGAVIASDKVMEPFLAGHGDVHARHHVRRPSGAGGDRAQEHRDHAARADRRTRRRAAGRVPRRRSRSCSTCRSSATCAGPGYFYALELVKDKETRETFSEDECETLLRGFLSPRLFERGLICRADDRGDPVIQISPPLVAEQAQFDEIVGILGEVLAEAWEQVAHALGREGAVRRDPR